MDKTFFVDTLMANTVLPQSPFTVTGYAFSC